MKTYAVIIEPTSTGFSAYVPDLPGCITVGHTIDETRECMKTSMQLHIEMLRELGEPIPEPTSQVLELSA